MDINEMETDITNSALSPNIAIGVGCIWFGVENPSAGDKSYFDTLEKTLADIDSIF